MNFIDLPDDILFTIISYLKIGERMVLCQLSKRFKVRITSYTRICDFEYQYAISQKEAITYIKSNAKNILKMNISSCFWFNKVSTYNSICLCTNLQEFSAIYFNISPKNIINILSKTPNLRSLSIQLDEPLKKEDCSSEFIEVMKNLQHFTIFVDGEHLFEVSNFLYLFTKLLTLSFKVLKKTNLTRFTFPKYCHELYKLTIDCPFINKNHLSYIKNEYFLDSQKTIYFADKNLLSSFESKIYTNLVTLEMCNKNVDIARLSGDLINLEYLCLHNCHIFTRQKLSFSFPKLFSLHITKNIYEKPSDLTVVCNGLHCPKLKEFVIVNYYVAFQNESDLQNILNLKDLHCLKLPNFHYNGHIGYPNHKILKIPRVSHLSNVTEDLVGTEYILEKIVKNNPHLKTLSLPPLHRGMDLNSLNNLFYLTHLTYDLKETIEKDFILYGVLQSSPYLSHLTITNLSNSITTNLLNSLLLGFESLIYLNLSRDDLFLPYTISFAGCKRLIFFIFCFKYQCNYLDIDTTPVKLLEKHHSLSFVIALSPAIKKIREISVKSKPAAKFMEIPICQMNLYQNIIDGKV